MCYATIFILLLKIKYDYQGASKEDRVVPSPCGESLAALLLLNCELLGFSNEFNGFYIKNFNP